MIKSRSKAIGLAILISANSGLAAEAPIIENCAPDSHCQVTATKDERIAEAAPNWVRND